MTGPDLAARLLQQRFDFFTGVPCSLIESLIEALEHDARVGYLPAVREDVAVGVAAGAWLAGRRPVVLMQNSGLGTSLNALASLSLMYGLPVLLVVTWRGYQGKDAPEHLLMGEITPALLQLLGIPHRVLARDSIDADLDWAVHAMDERGAPVALVVPPGVVDPSPAARRATAVAAPAALPIAAMPAEHLHPAPLVARRSRRDAIEAVISSLDDEVAVHANGFICRESFSVKDRAENFYMIGSMGLAAPIGLGMALAAPARRTVVLDGDGNLLMSLGILAMVAAARPARFVHCLFDNEAYGSTGNQASPAREVRLDALAAAAGYRTAAAVTEPGDLREALRAARSREGPHFILVKVTTEEVEAPRIPYPPATIRDRVRASLQRRI